MFDLGWSEMAVVVVIALLVLGPKQLPEALKTVTQLTRKARRYAQEFRSGIDGIVREAELEDARDALKSVRSANPSKVLQDLVDPTGELDDEMRELERTTKAEASKMRDGLESETGDAAKTENSMLAPGDGKESVSGSSESADFSGPDMTPKVKDVEKAAETEAAPAAAKRVAEPAKVAPAHSLRPPPGEDIFASKTDAAPADTTAKAAEPSKSLDGPATAGGAAKTAAKAPAKRAVKTTAKTAATKAPAKRASKAPTKTAAKAPTKTTAKAPTKAPAKTAAKGPAKTSAKAPTKAPAKTAAKAPARAPAKAPAKTAAKAKAPARTAKAATNSAKPPAGASQSKPQVEAAAAPKPAANPAADASDDKPKEERRQA
ncbi:MAG: hypothetical protein Kilf2KO_21380 [Rhodospirillales bacterium]